MDPSTHKTSAENYESGDRLGDEVNWVDMGEEIAPPNSNSEAKTSASSVAGKAPVVMVETAFLASMTGLIWLIDTYFPPGPLLRLLFPIPVASIYLRRGSRAAIMTALTATLLLSILMGPARSILFAIPYGVMGVQLGAFWRRGRSWWSAVAVGTLLSTLGVFFRFWLLSIYIGEDLWVYVLAQMTELAQWLFLRLGFLAQPSPWQVQVLAVGIILLNSILYLVAVHLVALLTLERLGTPIPPPPRWLQVIIDY